MREDVAYLEASPLIADDVPVRGFTYSARDTAGGCEDFCASR